jgi:hypothetical protein
MFNITERLAVGRPMASDAPSLSILQHLSATSFPLLFFTPPIPPLCCRPWTEHPVERDLTPGTRTAGGAPPWGEEHHRSLMLRTCSLRVHAELTGD